MPGIVVDNLARSILFSSILFCSIMTTSWLNHDFTMIEKRREERKEKNTNWEWEPFASGLGKFLFLAFFLWEN